MYFLDSRLKCLGRWRRRSEIWQTVAVVARRFGADNSREHRVDFRQRQLLPSRYSCLAPGACWDGCLSEVLSGRADILQLWFCWGSRRLVYHRRIRSDSEPTAWEWNQRKATSETVVNEQIDGLRKRASLILISPCFRVNVLTDGVALFTTFFLQVFVCI